MTAIAGGHGYSITPDICVINIDIRTTPSFSAETAQQILEEAIAIVDERWQNTQPTQVQIETCWPPYALPDNSALHLTFLHAAKSCALALKPKIAGPSNIGNYLAGLNVPAVAGFGADYIGLHAKDERIRVESIVTVFAVYNCAITRLLSIP